MKKILGLDLGSTSIGWAYIEEHENNAAIKKLGVRVIPYSGDEKDQFTKGQAISVNKDRTQKRTARKTNFRYKLRREKLIEVLVKMEMLPDENLIKKIHPVDLFALRAKAASEKITLKELGRVLLLLNQKRGYKSSRSGGSEEESGKKLSDYLTEISERKEILKTEGLTIGQYFYSEFLKNNFFQTRKKVFPRECYVAEFDKIWETQQKFHNQLLTDDLKKTIKEDILFYQRRLKSQKNLVGECRFEKYHKVAPKSSPLFQLEKIWESINTITLTNKYKETYPISIEQKRKIFDYLDSNDRLTKTHLLKILNLSLSDGWHPNEQIKKAGLQGNTTKAILTKTFQKLEVENYEALLKFEIVAINQKNVDKETGELKEEILIKPDFEHQPLYKIWHLIYSIDESELLKKALKENFSFTDKQADELVAIDFKKSGFGNKSAKAIRKILPGLMTGQTYSSAAEQAGYNHSESLTKEENQQRLLKDELELYSKNSLRQPVVEKIMNQLVNLVNAIMKDPGLGRPDEIRIELARDLRQSKEERNKAYAQTINGDRIHKDITNRIQSEFPGMPVTRKVIEKYKLFEQQEGRCMYSGRNMELSMVLRGESVDIDHIIPQSRLFDDSFQNKVLVFRIENENKKNETAYDYMNSKSSEDFKQYIERIEKIFDAGKITRSKRDKLLMKGNEIPEDFITRQMNETRFISREALSLLKKICFNVYSTSGSVTEFLRNQWGYNEVLKQLNWNKYEEAGKIENGKISDWSKRDDHRHHAIDALVVACTKQSYIQQINTLNSIATRQQLLDTVSGRVETGWQSKRSLLDQYVQIVRPFNTQTVKEAVSEILISIKAGKKVATKNINRSNGQITLTPRGQLHKEQVYGQIKRYAKVKTALNTKFNKAEKIANSNEKDLVLKRLSDFDNDPKKAFKDLDKNPIWIDQTKGKLLTSVTLWEDVFVYKYPLDINFKEKDIDAIVDIGVREKVRQRFIERKGQKDHPLKNLNNDPIWLNENKRIPIVSVRCETGLTDLVPLHSSENGITFNSRTATASSKPNDYVSTRNNHHIAIYEKPDGKLEEISVTLWEAVERKKLKLPVIVNDPKSTWDYILNKGIESKNILENLPLSEWKLVVSLQQNELFVFRMNKEELNNALKINDLKSISPNLYRVQKIASKDYNFRHHLETRLEKPGEETKVFQSLKKLIRLQSLEAFKKQAPLKIRINVKGDPELMDT